MPLCKTLPPSLVYVCGCAGSIIEQDTNLSNTIAITSCRMSCGAEDNSNRAFVSSEKTARAVFFLAKDSSPPFEMWH